MAAPDNSITLQINSDTVNGTLTQFVADDGDLLVVSGKPVGIVKQRVSNTQLKLYWPWDGPAITDETKWKVLPYGANWHSVVVFNTRLATLLDKYEAGIGVQVNASGTLAERAAYDAAPPPFVYLQNDVTPYQLFSKKSATAGDWSAPSPLGGTGGGTGGVVPPPPTPTTPQNTSAPVISDMNPSVGSILSVTTGSWSGYPSPTFSYQWRANGTAITSATSNTYTVGSGDTGKRISCSVTATNSQGSNSATTASTNAVTAGSGADTTPNAFSFLDVTAAAPSTAYTSNAITVDGINAPAPISITGTGATYSINGGSFTAASGTVNQGDTVVVQITSAAANNAVVNAVLTIGGVSDTYSVTTAASGGTDSTPDQFTFNDVSGATLSTTYTSDPIIVTGINVSAPVSIQNGQWSKNNGAFTAGSGTVVNGDSVQVKVNSASTAQTPVNVVLTIGGVSDTFTVTTAPASGTSLQTLTLNNTTFAENSPAGTPIGQLQNTTPGSTLALTNNSGGRVAISGTKLMTGSTVTDFEATPNFDVTVTETLAGVAGSPKTTTLTLNVVNVNETGSSSSTSYPTLTNGMVGPVAPAGGYTVRTGDMTISAAGTYKDLDVRGQVWIRANNVVLENSKISSTGFYGVRIDAGLTGCVVRRCDVDGNYLVLNGIGGSGTFENNIVRRTENAFNIEGSVPFMIRQNYCYDFKKDPNDNGHRDGIQIFGDGGTMTGQVIGNTVIMDGTPFGNCALYTANTFGPLANIIVKNNWASDPGGGYTCSFQGSGAAGDKMTNVRFEDNYLVRGYADYLYNSPGAQGTPVIFQNNVTVLPANALDASAAPWIVNGVTQAQGSGGGSGPVALQGLALTNGTVISGAPAGTVCGTVRLRSDGATLSLPDNAGGRFALDNGQIVTTATPTDYNVATSHSITVRETLAGATGSPKDTVLTITVQQGASGAVTLQALTMASSTIVANSPANTVVGTVQGKTANSSLSLTNSAGGRFALNNSNLVLATTTGAAGSTYSVTVTETLAGATNSPRSTTFTITVAATAPTLQALTLSNASVPENIAAGALIGTIQNTTANSTLGLINDAGGRVAISGGNLVRGAAAFDYETATSHSIIIEERLTGATNSPRQTTLTITVTDVVEGGSNDSVFAHTGDPGGSSFSDLTNDPALNGGITLGMKFTANASGTVDGVWFWQDTNGFSAFGTVRVDLWTAAGAPLATKNVDVVAIGTTPGWKFVAFDAPVNVASGNYIVSYSQIYDNARVYYRFVASTFASPVVSANGTVTGTQGVWTGGSTVTAPTTAAGSNGSYCVDVGFKSTAPTTDAVFSHTGDPGGASFQDHTGGGDPAVAGGITLGMKFTALAAGKISGVWYWQDVSDYSAFETIEVDLWNATTGAKLASKVVSWTSGVGWKYQPFDTPVTVAANQQLVASYSQLVDNSWVYYRLVANTFTSPVTSPNGKLRGVQGVWGGGSTAAFPTNAAGNDGGYCVDVRYDT